MLDKVKVVLVGTSHSGNIGSAARAMKVMGLSQLVLVAPQCERDQQTVALASGASDVAMKAEVVATMEEAVADCQLVIGSSARSRTLNWPMLEPRECGLKLIDELMQIQQNQAVISQSEQDAERVQEKQVAIVFGRERTGLTNDELQLCHYHVCIPANPDYSSLNLAMAVQTIAYEIRMAWLGLDDKNSLPEQEEYPRHDDLERFFVHLQDVIVKTEFISPEQPGKVMNKLRRFFTRARPERQELNMLRGILTSVEWFNKEKSATKSQHDDYKG